MALWIKAGTIARVVEPAHGRSFTLAELQAFVSGFIEIVSASHGHWLVLNEDGKRLHLPANAFATEIYHAAGGNRSDHIVGDVLLANSVEIGSHDEED